MAQGELEKELGSPTECQVDPPEVEEWLMEKPTWKADSPGVIKGTQGRGMGHSLPSQGPVGIKGQDITTGS